MSGYGYSYNRLLLKADEPWTKKPSYAGDGGYPSGYVPHDDKQWTKPSYAARDGGDSSDHVCRPVIIDANGTPGGGYSSDHVCRPVIVDADGRKRPLVSYSIPNRATPTKMAPPTDYEVVAPRPEATRPAKFGSLGGAYQRQTPTSTAAAHYGINGGGDNLGYSADYRRSTVEPNIPKKMVPPTDYEAISPRPEATRPSRFGSLGGAYRRQAPTSTAEAHYGINGGGGDDHSYSADYRSSTAEPNIPTKMVPPTNYDAVARRPEATRPARFGPLGDAYRRQTPTSTAAVHYGINGSDDDDHGYSADYRSSTAEPNIITSDGWARPSRSTWATPPGQEGQLTKPTSDVGAAMEVLKEAAKSPDGYTGYCYTEIIDSREAAWWYGNQLNLMLRHNPEEETYTTTIDSREASRKYGGAKLGM